MYAMRGRMVLASQGPDRRPAGGPRLDSVTGSYPDVVERVARAAAASGRDPGEVAIVAVSKGHEPAAIEAVYDQGHRDFGESRGQALAAKAHQLPADIRWHFIGPLQTNKVRIVRPHAVLLHSLDRDGLVGPWLKGLGDAPPALMQVNIGREPQKAGVEPETAEVTFQRWSEMGVRLAGIMCIPPLGAAPEDSRPFFAQMREIRDRLVDRHGHSLELSMGMTNDFEVAIEEGSTMIRVGTAIFGPRPEVDGQ